MMKKRVKNILFVFMLLSFFSFSQEKDFQTWTGLELKSRVLKKTDFICEMGIRLIDNSSQIGKYFSDFNIKRDYNSFLSYSFGYRYLLTRNDLVFKKKNRYYADVYIKKRFFKSVKINLRTRIQTQLDPDFAFLEERKDKFREKIKITYDIKRFDINVFLASEVFYILDEGFEKIRYITGFDKPLNKQVSLNVNYMLQKDVSNSINELLSVFRAKVCYNI